MSDAGRKIIEGLHEALAGNLARITIDGVTWVRKEELKRKDTEIERLRKALDHVRVMECGNKVYIGVIAGDGCCSAESHPDDKTMFLEWKKERDAALTASEAALPGHPLAAAQPKTESRS